jgi:hypothetical protein
MDKKPEQQLPVNETQSEQEQLEEALKSRIDAARRAADYLAELFGVTGGRAGEAGGKRGEGTKPGMGMGAKPAAGSPARSHSAPPAPSPHLPAYPAWLKRCEACGRSYTAEQWRALAFEAFERMSHDLAVEIRKCACCGATMGIAVHIVPCEVARMGEQG